MTSFTPSSVTLLSVLCIVFLTLLDTFWSYHAKPGFATTKGYCNLAFVGDDYPEYWELPPMPQVALVIEDPVHYAITGPDAREEWATTTPAGQLYFHDGPEDRAFTTSMFHQQHCLRLMRAAVAGDYRLSMQEHFAHCLQYFRQTIMCVPDLTLEPADILERDYNTGVKEVGSIHLCQDWRQVYDAMEEKWKHAK